MKSMRLNGLLICCILYLPAQAQLTIPIKRQALEKTLLFSGLPEKMYISTTTLGNLFDNAISDYVVIALQEQFNLEGTILEKVKKSAILESINIRLSNYEGGMFTLSKIRNSDLSFTYAGRIVSIDHGDVFILTVEKGRFFLVKQKRSLYLVE